MQAMQKGTEYSASRTCEFGDCMKEAKTIEKALVVHLRKPTSCCHRRSARPHLIGASNLQPIGYHHTYSR
eukprot:c36955_g1_i1 orf=2-208(-)